MHTAVHFAHTPLGTEPLPFLTLINSHLQYDPLVFPQTFVFP